MMDYHFEIISMIEDLVKTLKEFVGAIIGLTYDISFNQKIEIKKSKLRQKARKTGKNACFLIKITKFL